MNIKSSDYINPSGLSLIGNATIPEILTLLISPSIQTRREKWVLEIGQKLKELEDSNKIQIEDLSTNEQFIDTVLQATSHALKTSDKEKIKMFKNVIINTAVGDTPEQTISHIFLNLIDEFTTWHIKVLNFFNEPIAWFKSNNRSFPDYISSTLARIVTEAFPDLKDNDELLDLIGSNLYRSKLLNTGDLRGMLGNEGLIASRTTNLGKQFLRFISEN
jgi:hypothetical protein